MHLIFLLFFIQNLLCLKNFLGGLSPKEALEYTESKPDIIIVQVNEAIWKIVQVNEAIPLTIMKISVTKVEFSVTKMK